MISILAILYFVFLIVVVIRESIFIRKVHDLRIISGVRLMYALIYGLMPFLVLAAYDLNGKETYGIDYTESGMLRTLVLFGITILVYLLLCLGYNAKHQKKEYDFGDKNNNDARTLLSLAIFITILSAVSLYLWTRAYGGPSEMMAYAKYIRSGYSIRENNLAFFKRFAALSTLGAYLSYVFVLDKKRSLSVRIIALITLVISVYVKIMYSLIDDGRMTTAVFIVGFLAIFLYQRYREGKITIRQVMLRGIILLGIGYLLIIFCDPVMNLIRYGQFNMNVGDFNLFTSLRSELGYTFESSQKAMELRLNGYRYTFLNNLTSGLFAYLPTGLTPQFAKTNLTYINSVNLYGTGVQYGSPPDFISVCLYDIGFLGVILYPLILGIIIRRLDDFFDFYKSSIWGNTLFICLLFRIARIVANASFYNVAMSMFYLVFSIILYWIFKRLRFSGHGQTLSVNTKKRI